MPSVESGDVGQYTVHPSVHTRETASQTLKGEQEGEHPFYPRRPRDRRHLMTVAGARRRLA